MHGLERDSSLPWVATWPRWSSSQSELRVGKGSLRQQSATAAAPGASSASRARDEACQTSSGGAASKSPLHPSLLRSLLLQTEASSKSQRAVRKKSSTTSHAIAAATRASSASNLVMRRVNHTSRLPRGRHCRLHCFDPCCCRDGCFQRDRRAGRKKSSTTSRAAAAETGASSQAARVMKHLKPPWADCLEVATAYFTVSMVVAAGTDASSKSS